jgi:hypothetical protein
VSDSTYQKFSSTEITLKKFKILTLTVRGNSLILLVLQESLEIPAGWLWPKRGASSREAASLFL